MGLTPKYNIYSPDRTDIPLAMTQMGTMAYSVESALIASSAELNEKISRTAEEIESRINMEVDLKLQGQLSAIKGDAALLTGRIDALEREVESRDDQLIVYNGGQVVLGDATDARIVGYLAKTSGTIAGQDVEPGQVWIFVANDGNWQAYLAGGGGGGAVVASASRPTPKPSDITDTGVTVTWAETAGATSYEGRVNGGQIQPVTSPWKVAGLAPSSSHTVEVRSVGEAGPSAWATVAFKTLAPKPVGLAWLKASDFSYTFDPSLTVSTTASADDTVTASGIIWGRYAQTVLSMPGDGFVEFTAHPATNYPYSIRLVPFGTRDEQAYLSINPSGLEVSIPGSAGTGFLRQSTPEPVRKYRFTRTADSTRLDVEKDGAWVQLAAAPRMAGALKIQIRGSGSPTDFKVSGLAGAGWA